MRWCHEQRAGGEPNSESIPLGVVFFLSERIFGAKFGAVGKHPTTHRSSILSFSGLPVGNKALGERGCLIYIVVECHCAVPCSETLAPTKASASHVDFSN
jgi:hypothetical protein